MTPDDRPAVTGNTEANTGAKGIQRFLTLPTAAATGAFLAGD